MKKLIFLLLPLFLLASVKLSVNKTHLTKGEELVITITASGKDIKFPNITNIAGYNVIGTSIVSSIEVINGAMSEKLSKSYIIIPDRNITIPSFSVEVDGKIYKTKPVKIIVQEPKQTQGENKLEIKLSKNSLYIGESAILDVALHFKPPVESIQLQKPEIKGFIAKELYKNVEGNVAHYKFLLTPLKAGEYQIGPLLANIGVLVKENPFDDPMFNLSVATLKYKTIYSNKLKVKVLPIPQNSIWGDFNITLKAKEVVNANEPNEAILKVSGCGDFYNMPDFKLNIKNASVYPKKPKLDIYIKDDKICGSLTQKFTIISDTNYEIPPVTLKEFNGKLKVISTKPLNVKVISTTQKYTTIKPKEEISKPVEKTQINYKEYIKYLLILLAGIGIGAIVAILIKKDEYFHIRKATQKELFNILIPYSDNPKIKEILRKLEENIYKGANNKISKKEIIKILKEINSN